MTDHLAFLLLGLGSGAVFASLALALVMTYRSSGVINFATGAIALYAAYTYSFLRQGKLFVPLPWLPTSVSIGGDPGLFLAILITLALSAVLGALMYLLIFRTLRSAPPVAKAVASLGVMVMLQSLFASRLGTSPVTVRRIFPSHLLSVGHTRIGVDRLLFAATILAVAVVLSLAFRFTRFGLATRAAAETEKGAFVTGLSPDRIAVANWALSCAVAGLGGILIAPIVPLVPSSYTLFIVPALAAAFVASFQSMALAVVAALAIGMVQSEAAYLDTQHAWLPQHGLAEAVPLVLILLFLVVRGRALPERGALIVQTLGRAPRPRRIASSAVIGSAVAVAGLLLTSGIYRASLITSLIFAVISLSLVVVTGYAGQVSLAQLSLAGAGAFLLSKFAFSASIPFPISPLLAALGAAVIGVVLGLPALRIRGLSVAVATLALAVALEAFWFRNPDYTGGVQGASVPSPSLFGLDLGVGTGGAYPRVVFGILCLVVLVLVAVGVALLRRSWLGAAMLAVRANERAAAAAGINVARTKLLAFAIASFIAGLGGSLLAYQQTLASADVYSAFIGFGLFVTAYVAGITSISGGIMSGLIAAGGLMYVLINHYLSGLGSWYDVITGLVLVIQVAKNPEGLAEGLHRLSDRLDARRRPRAEAVTQSLSSPGQPPVVAVSETDRAVPLIDRSASPVLRVENISVRYGGVVAVKDVSLAVPAGAIVGLIGPNGAGKTTLIDVMSGFATYEGRVEFGGRAMDGLKPHERVHAGLGRTFQGLELWEDLSVEENVLVSRRRPGQRGGPSPVDDVFELLTLDLVRDRPVRELSQGQRQLVSIGRTLAGGPDVILLDEPAGGLDTSESRWLAERLREVRRSGVTIVLVDHDMNLVLELCDEIHVLDLGEVIATGTPAQIRIDRRVADAYLGDAHLASEMAL
jgi:ABC-type branched-subunit amino acid transport system ATPase component/branched-subunit amino acid ABC-type transport system permease component